MRVVRVEFEAGRDLFAVYWNFLQSGGVVAFVDGATENEPVQVVVRIRSLKKEWRLRGRVARVDEGRAFLAFEAGQDQEAMVNAAWADTYLVPQRKHTRYPARAKVRFAVAGEPKPAMLINVSKGGCCLEPEEPAAKVVVGARMTVHLPESAAGDPVEGRVRWVRPRSLGVEFARVLKSLSL